jgi:hypothetical protein
MERITRDRYLTPEEAAANNLIREKVMKEFPPLIKIEVNDPSKLISFVRLVEQTDRVIVLHVDLTKEGKRAEFDGIGGDSVCLSRGMKQAEIIISDLEREWTVYGGDAGRYTMMFTLVSTKLVEDFSKEQFLFYRE